MYDALLANLPETAHDKQFWLLRTYLAIAADAGFRYPGEFTVETLGFVPTTDMLMEDGIDPFENLGTCPATFIKTWAEDASYTAYCATAARFSTCPEHGQRKIISSRSTGGGDPYAIDVLDCGHRVVCYGPGEPNVIVR